MSVVNVRIVGVRFVGIIGGIGLISWLDHQIAGRRQIGYQVESIRDQAHIADDCLTTVPTVQARTESVLVCLCVRLFVLVFVWLSALTTSNSNNHIA